MLILSRRTNQRLFIGDSIQITVVEVRDGHVRLGITAPKNVSVFREELLDELAAENREAVLSSSTVDLPAAASTAVDEQGLPVVAVPNHSELALHQGKGG
jgi:carbon storage regulator